MISIALIAARRPMHPMNRMARPHMERPVRAGVALVGAARRWAAVWILCGLAAQAWAVDGIPQSPSDSRPLAAAPRTAGQLLDFDIPAQPLAAALKRYAVLSNWPTLFQSAMVAGRTSSAIRGLYLPETALHRLLEGTGLIAERADAGRADAFILKEIGTQAAVPRPSADNVDFDYGGWVQARVWQALCANPRTAADDYRSLLRFQVDASGHVQQVRLLGSTGDTRRDAALLATLQQVHVDRPPPPDMAQPLTMLILPREPGDADAGRRCGKDGDNEALRP